MVWALAKVVNELLNDTDQAEYLSKNARVFAQQHYDLQTVCLPRQLAWVRGMING
jgi:hypothetical protein